MLIQGYDAVQNPAPGSMLATGPVLLRGLLISYRIPGTRSYSSKLAIRTLIIICPHSLRPQEADRVPDRDDQQVYQAIHHLETGCDTICGNDEYSRSGGDPLTF